MARLWRRHTAEIAPARSPGLRLLPAMLVGVAVAAAIAYFALGFQPHAEALPELLLRVEGESLRLPDDTTCSLLHHGCDRVLARLPAGRIRVIAPADAMFALAAPALAVAADAHREALLDDGTGPVAVEPMRGHGMKDWSAPNEDLAVLRVRVILRSDGFWVGSAAGKLLGSDPRGPTLPPAPGGQDFNGLNRKLRSLKLTLNDHEESCGLLPALDTPVGDVVRATTAIHGAFDHVLLVVP